MRPKLILIILVIVELFLVLIAFSPSVGFSMQSIAAMSEWRRNPNPETERVMQREEAWNRWRPQIVWTLAVADPLLIFYVARRYKRAA